jgi:hypothetical protein
MSTKMVDEQIFSPHSELSQIGRYAIHPPENAGFNMVPQQLKFYQRYLTQ